MAVSRTTAQRETLDVFIQHWKNLSIEGMSSLYAKDLAFVGLPTAVLGGKEKTSEEWANFIRPMWAELSNFEVAVHSTTIDGEAGRAVLHANTYADLPVMAYRNEHIMILHFDKSGRKIIKLEDMMDSMFARELSQKMREYFKNKY